jgi:hypothetical protein
VNLQCQSSGKSAWLNPDRHYMEDEMTDLAFAELDYIEQRHELLEAAYKITGAGAGFLDTDENKASNIAVIWRE